jgi:hypothetical protein
VPVVPDGGAAVIKLRFTFDKRLKLFDLTGQGIVYAQH